MEVSHLKTIGYITKEIISLLSLDLDADTPIYIGDTNIAHTKNRHAYEYDKYFDQIEEIISEPDYVGKNPKDGSVSFVKEYEISGEYVRVAVRITTKKKCFAKTLHLLSTCNTERYIEKGTLKKLDKNSK